MSIIASISLDIEYNTSGRSLFDNSSADHKIQSICTKFYKNDSLLRQYAFILDYNSVDLDLEINTTVIQVNDEVELIMSWLNIIKYMKPQIMISWNLLDFDYTYIKKRSRELRMLEKFNEIEDKEEEITKYLIKGSINKIDLMTYITVKEIVFCTFQKALLKYGIYKYYDPKCNSTNVNYSLEGCSLFFELFQKLDLIKTLNLIESNNDSFIEITDNDALFVEI